MTNGSVPCATGGRSLARQAKSIHRRRRGGMCRWTPGADTASLRSAGAAAAAGWALCVGITEMAETRLPHVTVDLIRKSCGDGALKGKLFSRAAPISGFGSFT
ncbi:hypothetical protein FA95DRAFT_1556659 [Auriscalpium vulgare]|uniref:Uncharacterized protein n=1 Tax=Auriscalpium vulgare TaxID=40419 RepID=A0ACB8RZI8_9AGAM|nr:hypothetical protein FA95DRAFT_1556659 [Auriscalpium vulgare]